MIRLLLICHHNIKCLLSSGCFSHFRWIGDQTRGPQKTLKMFRMPQNVQRIATFRPVIHGVNGEAQPNASRETTVAGVKASSLKTRAMWHKGIARSILHPHCSRLLGAAGQGTRTCSGLIDVASFCRRVLVDGGSLWDDPTPLQKTLSLWSLSLK